MEPRVFGRYTLLDHMGKGGVGSVFRARDDEDGSIVAVKVFESGQKRPPEMSRKLCDREVRMLVSIRHPNVVRFLEQGQVEDDHYYAMEFVENSLLKRMRGVGAFGLVDKVQILRQTTGALAAIHRQGIVHRDIKPGNILLDQDPSGAIHVKLTDLGIAKDVSETDIVHEQMPSRIPGTAKYLSPEQIRLLPVDGRADIFSLGVVAYELIAGTPPFKGETSEEYLLANAEGQQQPADQVADEIPTFLAEMIQRMLVKDREERYDSDTLLRDLELAQQHLISGAPLVERANPASLFYEPPAWEAQEGPEPRPWRAVAPVSWGLALTIVLAGVIVSVVLWPDAPSLAQAKPEPVKLPPSTPAERLQQAAAVADSGRYWQASALLRALPNEELPPQARGRAERLSRRIQEALAEDAYSSAAKMLGQNRSEEAQIVLWWMEECLPEAERTRQLDAAIRDRQRAASLDDRWDAAVRDTYTLVRRRRYAEALAARKRLLDDFGADPDKARTARLMIGDLLDHWARALLRAHPRADAIEEFFGAVDGHAAIVAGKPSASQMAALRLRLADAYRAGRRYELALEQYELAAGAGDADVERRARRAGDELRRWLADRPHDAADFARELERSGFQGNLWRKGAAPGGTQDVADGVLRFRSRGGARATTIYRESARPVRNLGFAAGVQFKASPAMLASPGRSRAGIGVIGTNGNVFEFAFDGRSYQIARKSGRVSARGTVRRALGDEDRAWHTLGLRHSFDTGRLAVLLDGKELQRYSVDLSDFRLRVFLETAGPPAGVEFRGVFCRP